MERPDAILKRLREQVDWRSPISGRPQGIVTIPRDDAVKLLEYLAEQSAERRDL